MSGYSGDQSDLETLGLLDQPITSPTTSTITNGHNTQNSSTSLQPQQQQSSSTSFNDPSQRQMKRKVLQKRVGGGIGGGRGSSNSYGLRGDDIDDPTQEKDLGSFALIAFFAILTIAALMLVTIYTIKTTNTPTIPPLYRHVSTFGPSFRVDPENNVDDDTKKAFFPSIWLPTVDRSTILETILSQTKTEIWVPTSTLYQPKRLDKDGIPIYSELDLQNYLTDGTYPSSSSSSSSASSSSSSDQKFISHTTSANSFPLTLPTSKLPISSYVSSQYTPVHPIYIIQFYAHWCGHCRRFSSHAENLAHTFNANPSSPIRMLRVHCAGSNGLGHELCQALGITAYPQMLIGTQRNWLWLLNQIMPEFHQRTQLWYVISRGSTPPPGQGIIDTKGIDLRTINKEIIDNILTRIPSSQSTAELVVDWVNIWLKENYKRHRDNILKRNNQEVNQGGGSGSGSGSNTNDGQENNDITTNNGINLNLLQLSVVDSFQFYMKYYSEHNFELNPKSKKEIDFYNKNYQLNQQIKFKSIFNDMIKIDLNLLTQDQLEKVQKELLHRAGDYEFDWKNNPKLINQWIDQSNGLPLDDMLGYITLPSSIKTGTKYFNNLKPTRYYDPRISFNVRPSLISSIYNAASIYLPVSYSTLTQEQLERAIVKDLAAGNAASNGDSNNNNKNGGDKKDENQTQISSSSSSSSSSSTLLQNSKKQTFNTPLADIFRHGYPDQSNLNDKMLYWSITLRDAIPQCHRTQMSLFQTQTQEDKSSKNTNIIDDQDQEEKKKNSKQDKLNEILNEMRNQLGREYLSSPEAYELLNKDLLYTPPSQIRAAINSSSSSSQTHQTDPHQNDSSQQSIKHNQYLESQTCYEALHDMLDMMCVLSSKNEPPSDNELKDDQFTIFNGIFLPKIMINNKNTSKLDNWSQEHKCQHSFCYLRHNLDQFLLPPQRLGQLYQLHSLSGHIAPILNQELTQNVATLPKFKHIAKDWNLCYDSWENWDKLDWQQCKGSITDSRGYTCALWSNLHGLSVGLDYHAKKKSNWIINQQHNSIPQTKTSIMLQQSEQEEKEEKEGKEGKEEEKSTENSTVKKQFFSIESRFALTLRSYLKHFFLCEECQEHILSYSNQLPFILTTTTPISFLSSLPAEPDANNTNNKNGTQIVVGTPIIPDKPIQKHGKNNKSGHEDESDSHEGQTEFTPSFPPSEYLVLWLWYTHNMVNLRLAAVEKAHSAGDPLFPKVYFPLHYKCTTCRDGIGSVSACYNQSSTSSTGNSSAGKDNTNNQVVVPAPVVNSDSINNLSDNCLWDKNWSYFGVYDHLVQFYLPQN